MTSHPLEAYAESYEQMSRTGVTGIHPATIAVDIRQNMIPVTTPLVTAPNAMPEPLKQTIAALRCMNLKAPDHAASELERLHRANLELRRLAEERQRQVGRLELALSRATAT